MNLYIKMHKTQKKEIIQIFPLLITQYQQLHKSPQNPLLIQLTY